MPSALKCYALPGLVRSPLRAAPAVAFLDLGCRDRPGESAAQLFGRLQCQLDGDPRTRPEGRVHEVDVDRLFQQGVMRVVVGHDRGGHFEPSVTPLARAGRLDDLDDRGAHLPAAADATPPGACAE